MLEVLLNEIICSCSAFESFVGGKVILVNNELEIIPACPNVIIDKTSVEKLVNLSYLRKSTASLRLNVEGYSVCCPVQKDNGIILGYVCILELKNEDMLSMGIALCEVMARLIHKKWLFVSMHKIREKITEKMSLNSNIKLTEREHEIAELVALAKVDREIADILYISISTVRIHIKNIFEKLNVNKRIEIAIWYYSRLLSDA